MVLNLVNPYTLLHGAGLPSSCNRTPYQPLQLFLLTIIQAFLCILSSIIMPTLLANDNTKLYYCDVGSVDAPALILVSLTNLFLMSVFDCSCTVAWLHRLFGCLEPQHPSPVKGVQSHRSGFAWPRGLGQINEWVPCVAAGDGSEECY